MNVDIPMLKFNISCTGTSLVVQWFGLCALTAEDTGSIPDWGANIPQEYKWLEHRRLQSSDIGDFICLNSDCTTPRMDFNVNYGLWVIIFCQCGSSAVTNGRGYTCVQVENIQEISALLAQS